jgi:hypothetical protein
MILSVESGVALAGGLLGFAGLRRTGERIQCTAIFEKMKFTRMPRLPELETICCTSLLIFSGTSHL